MCVQNIFRLICISAQGVDECMINVHYYYYLFRRLLFLWENSSVWEDRDFVIFFLHHECNESQSLHGDKTYLAI